MVTLTARFVWAGCWVLRTSLQQHQGFTVRPASSGESTLHRTAAELLQIHGTLRSLELTAFRGFAKAHAGISRVSPATMPIVLDCDWGGACGRGGGATVSIRKNAQHKIKQTVQSFSLVRHLSNTSI